MLCAKLLLSQHRYQTSDSSTPPPRTTAFTIHGLGSNGANRSSRLPHSPEFSIPAGLSPDVKHGALEAGFIAVCQARRHRQGGGSGGPNPASGLSHRETWVAHAPPYLLRDVFSILPQDPAPNQDLAAKERGGVSGGGTLGERKEMGKGREGVGAGAWPVRHLLLCEALVALQQDGDVVADHAHEEGDEDDGQHHPQPDVGIQQQLGLAHRDSVPALFLTPTPTRLPLGLRPLPGRPRPRLHFRFRWAPEWRHRAPAAGSSSSGSGCAAWGAVGGGARRATIRRLSSSAVTCKGESRAISLF